MISKKEYEEFHNNYVKMWDWLSKNPSRSKSDYFEKINNEINVTHACYACEVSRIMSGTDEDLCLFCPLKELCHNLYFKWVVLLTKKERSLYAEKIRDIPWIDYEQYVDDFEIIKFNENEKRKSREKRIEGILGNMSDGY